MMLELLNARSPSRIVGGAYINITLVPYMISLMLNNQHMCGGGIVNKNWAVTAAHCLTPFVHRQKELRVRSGSSYIDQDGDVHTISKVIVHERYNSETNDYDVGVVKVNPPFKYSINTKPLIVATNDSIERNYGLVAGWGYFLDFNPVLSRQLQYVFLPRVDKEECKKNYNNRYSVPDTQECYGFKRGGEDTCKGDSGGPMVNKNEILIGITSWGDGCAEPNSPGVYTNAILLRDWITNKTTNKNNVG